MFKSIEKGVGFKHSIRDFFKQVTAGAVGAGFLAAIFGVSAGLAYTGYANNYGGMTPDQIGAWVTSVFFISGLFAIFYPLYYRKPVNFANSIPGAALFTSMMVNFSLEELMAGGLISGILLVILGLTGQVKRVMKYVPVPIVMAMIAGVFMKFGVNIVNPLTTAPIAVILMVAAYFICSKWLPKVPGVIASLIVGFLYFIITGLKMPALSLSFQLPTLIMPKLFSPNILRVILTYSIPLTILIIGAENAQAYGVLVAEKYDAPLNSMTLWSGIGGIVSSFFCLHNTNVAGPMTAICASPDVGEKDSRWTASVIQGILWVLVGPVFASFASFFSGLPSFFYNAIVGLAILKVLINALSTAFGSPKFRFSSAFALVIGISGLSLLGISAPFWSLVGGMIIYLCFERVKSTDNPQLSEEKQ